MAQDVTSKFDLTGKTVVITGATGFLGEYFTQAVKEAGATVVTTDVNDKADVVMDVTDKASIEKTFQQIVDEYGGIDVLINNAAIDPKFEQDSNQNQQDFENYPEEALDQSLQVNLKGYVLTAQAAVHHMKQAGKGNIINISSIYGIGAPHQNIYPEGTQKPVDYSITKGGVVMLTKWLAATYGKDNIRSNTYTLGAVLRGHAEDFKEKYNDLTPLGRMVDPQEIGGPLVFLASDASVGMTGANLVVDGGWSAW